MPTIGIARYFAGMASNVKHRQRRVHTYATRMPGSWCWRCAGSENGGWCWRRQSRRYDAGAGAESGIPVFQGTSWHGHSHYELANIEAWERDPKLVWEYYSDRRARASDASPNAAHIALAGWEKGFAGGLFLCTQNVDGLHEAAGSQEVVPYPRQTV
ncbi:MAG TPA: Sir2 family NAD-dependent protein deacetylase [Candidatus Angelobacter sp.]|nr:Sir2 family NAD-dependent protein deacetylase [Candidatus Angelobacter sp.]